MKKEVKDFTERLALNLRKRLENEGLLENNTLSISADAIESIVNVCGGKLQPVINKSDIKLKKRMKKSS